MVDQPDVLILPKGPKAMHERVDRASGRSLRVHVHTDQKKSLLNQLASGLQGNTVRCPLSQKVVDIAQQGLGL